MVIPKLEIDVRCCIKPIVLSYLLRKWKCVNKHNFRERTFAVIILHSYFKHLGNKIILLICSE